MDVAHTVAFLLSKKARFITGQTIYVDGGKSIGVDFDQNEHRTMIPCHSSSHRNR
ncbi:MAG: SDR family oxidoreductase [Flavobacteriales bacterium]|nr:SDR family oxidoreductase [Flavobacteriales bacterium]